MALHTSMAANWWFCFHSECRPCRTYSYRGARIILVVPPRLVGLLHCPLLLDTNCGIFCPAATYRYPNQFAAICPTFVQSVRCAVGLGGQLVKARDSYKRGARSIFYMCYVVNLALSAGYSVVADGALARHGQNV